MVDVVFSCFLFWVAGDPVMVLLLNVREMLHLLVVELQKVSLDFREGVCVLLDQLLRLLLPDREQAAVQIIDEVQVERMLPQLQVADLHGMVQFLWGCELQGACVDASLSNRFLPASLMAGLFPGIDSYFGLFHIC